MSKPFLFEEFPQWAQNYIKDLTTKIRELEAYKNANSITDSRLAININHKDRIGLPERGQICWKFNIEFPEESEIIVRFIHEEGIGECLQVSSSYGTPIEIHPRAANMILISPKK